MAVFCVNSGSIDINAINTVFGLGDDINSYRGHTWYNANNASGTLPSGAINYSDFYGKGPTSPVVAGSNNFTSPGTYAPTIPLYNSLVITVKGGGGTGGTGGYYVIGEDKGGPIYRYYNGSDGTDGADSTLSFASTTLTGTGGGKGTGGSWTGSIYDPGKNGSSSSSPPSPISGTNGASGGGSGPGTATTGGGGAGGSGSGDGGNGGNGGEEQITWSFGGSGPSPGSTVTIVVGGPNGSVSMSWT